MKFIVAFSGLLFVSLSAFASTLQCEVTDGVFRGPADTVLVNVATRDPTLIGSIFHVERETGEIVGGSLFSNEHQEVTILRDINEIINVIEIQSINDHADLTYLAVKEFDGKLAFSYFAGFLNLLLVGECTKD